MIIERSLSRYIVFAEDSLLNALGKISENKTGSVFSVTESGHLEGVLTDGDFRRWVVSGADIDMNLPVKQISNKDFVSMAADANYEDIEAQFDQRVKVVPLVDKNYHLVAVAHNLASVFKIGDFDIGDDKPTFIIAEIGNNHNGDIEQAKKLVDRALYAGADCVKFQMRSMRDLYLGSGDDTNGSEDLGSQYTLDLLSRFQLTSREMFEVFDYCKARNILPLCTPWDLHSLEELEAYGVVSYKLASADLTNHELLDAMARTGKPLIVSTGMSNESEIVGAVEILRHRKAHFILLHCNSAYPAPFKDINLNYIYRLKEIGACPVGYSGHERGIAIPMAAVAKGARVIEKHFTLDKNLEGNDHRVSLLPEEFKAMVKGIREIEQALGTTQARRITQGELMNREVLGKSLVINRSLEMGETIKEDMIEIRSPGKGISPNRKRDLIGMVARRSFSPGDFFFLSDIEAERVEPRRYEFGRPFGIPVRYHDLAAMAELSNFDFVEFHLSYKDIEESPQKHIPKPLDLDFVVHSPELFPGDHILDLCAHDLEYRARSVQELQRVVDLTRDLKPFFQRSDKPRIVINAGGYSLDDFVPVQEREALHDMVAESLAEIDQEGVEIIPQTMPPFPWHFGGQRYHNLFMMPDDIERFCRLYGYRICLDVSHSQLTCNQFNISLRHFLQQVGAYTTHCHIVDAEGVDGEGLQIADGMIDFSMLAEILDEQAPAASFIPEIWQGHKNNGEGFWIALERLERWF